MDKFSRVTWTEAGTANEEGNNSDMKLTIFCDSQFYLVVHQTSFYQIRWSLKRTWSAAVSLTSEAFH